MKKNEIETEIKRILERIQNGEDVRPIKPSVRLPRNQVMESFIARKAEIAELIQEGYSMKTIHLAMNQLAYFHGTIETFRRYAKKFGVSEITQDKATSQPVAKAPEETTPTNQSGHAPASPSTFKIKQHRKGDKL